MVLPRTYLLRFQVDDQPAGFEPILCRNDAEALAQARQRLEARADCEAIEVCVGDTILFQVGRAD